MTLTISANYNTCPKFNAALDEHATTVSDRIACEITHVRKLK